MVKRYTLEPSNRGFEKAFTRASARPATQLRTTRAFRAVKSAVRDYAKHSSDINAAVVRLALKDLHAGQ